MDTQKINDESAKQPVSIEISTIPAVDHYPGLLYYCQPSVTQGLAAVLFYIIYNRYEKNITKISKIWGLGY